MVGASFDFTVQPRQCFRPELSLTNLPPCDEEDSGNWLPPAPKSEGTKSLDVSVLVLVCEGQDGALVLAEEPDS